MGYAYSYKGLYPYELRFRKAKGGKLHSWVRYYPNITVAKADVIKVLNREYNNPVLVSIKRLSIAREKRMIAGYKP